MQNVWLSTSLESGSWNEDMQTWTLNARRDGEMTTMTAKHVIFATGTGSQVPLMPTYDNRVGHFLGDSGLWRAVADKIRRMLSKDS